MNDEIRNLIEACEPRDDRTMPDERTMESEQYERWVAELSAIAREDESLDDALDRVIEAAGRPEGDALEEAADEISALCGCPEWWDYPQQLVRDVRAVVEERDALRAEVADLRAQLRGGR